MHFLDWVGKIQSANCIVTCIHIHAYTHTYVCIYMCAHVPVCTCLYVSMQFEDCTYIHFFFLDGSLKWLLPLTPICCQKDKLRTFNYSGSKKKKKGGMERGNKLGKKSTDVTRNSTSCQSQIGSNYLQKKPFLLSECCTSKGSLNKCIQESTRLMESLLLTLPTS